MTKIVTTLETILVACGGNSAKTTALPAADWRQLLRPADGQGRGHYPKRRFTIACPTSTAQVSAAWPCSSSTPSIASIFAPLTGSMIISRWPSTIPV
jgi:hypothetical protein